MKNSFLLRIKTLMEYYVINEGCMFRKYDDIHKIRFGSAMYIYDSTLEKWVKGFVDIKGTCNVPTNIIPRLFKARKELLYEQGKKDWVLWQLF